MFRRLIAFLALIALGPLGTQATARPYPSLAKRPLEARDPRSEPKPAPVEPAEADPVLEAEVETLTRKAEAGDKAFAARLGSGRETVAQAAQAEPVSEPWVAAQLAISALDSARYDSVAALASLDTLHIDRMNDKDGARVAADMATIDPARSRVLAMVDQQNDALDALRSDLKAPRQDSQPNP